jgi:hypothetical protein
MARSGAAVAAVQEEQAEIAWLRLRKERLSDERSLSIDDKLRSLELTSEIIYNRSPLRDAEHSHDRRLHSLRGLARQEKAEQRRLGSLERNNSTIFSGLSSSLDLKLSKRLSCGPFFAASA